METDCVRDPDQRKNGVKATGGVLICHRSVVTFA